MSVKLPLIVKKETINNIHPKTSKEDLLKHAEEIHLQHSVDQYDNHNDFESIQEIQVEEDPKPLETITVLKGQSRTIRVEQQKKQNKEQKAHQKQNVSMQNLEQLINKAEENERVMTQIKDSIANKKKEIKTIGQQIDKDLNKSIMKASKQHIVNIRDIFSAKATNTDNKKLNILNQQLKKIRINTKKMKAQIQKLQDTLADPVNMMNLERGIDCQRRIRIAQSDIKTVEHQKTLLSQQITRGEEDVNQTQEKQKNEKLSLISHQLSQIQNAQKQQKLEMYRIQKEDISLMEKIKFFQEKETLLGPKKIKTNQKTKQKLQQEIKQLIHQINQVVQERNKIQRQKKLKAKNLANQKTALQTKNWELCNKIRQIDAFLLQYYQRKTKKKELKQNENADVIEKSVSGKIQVQSVISDHLYKSKISQNDKNLPSQIVLVQKRKNYEFGYKQTLQNQINLSDDFLGSKININKIEIAADSAAICKISASYTNIFSCKIDGLTMGSKKLPENVQILHLQLAKDELINFIHIGYCQKFYITFLQIITSQGKQLKWGKMQNLMKSEQKHIKKYETSYLKAKLIEQTNSQNKTIIYLAGLTLATTFLTPK